MIHGIMRNLHRFAAINIHDEKLLIAGHRTFVNQPVAVRRKERLTLVHMRELVSQRKSTLLREHRLHYTHHNSHKP
jgi:hypothetical protein